MECELTVSFEQAHSVGGFGILRDQALVLFWNFHVHNCAYKVTQVEDK